jgi:hypothetical protein
MAKMQRHDHTTGVLGALELGVRRSPLTAGSMLSAHLAAAGSARSFPSEKNVRGECASLRQSPQSGHSFSGAYQRPERRRMRTFPAILPNRGLRLRSPFWAVFRLSRPPFSDATEPRPFLVRMSKTRQFKDLHQAEPGGVSNFVRSGEVITDRIVRFKLQERGSARERLQEQKICLDRPYYRW